MSNRTTEGSKARKRRPPPIGRRLRAECDKIEAHVRARKLATDEQIQEARPAQKADAWAWAFWYGTLRAWVWTEDATPTRRMEEEERLLEALREEPVVARLLSGERVEVYPKGLHALMWFRGRDWLVGWLSDRLDLLRWAADNGELDQKEVPDVVTVQARIEEELHQQLTALAVVACTPGPGMREGDPMEGWPDWTATLTPIDLFTIHQAFSEVNLGRMEALEWVAPVKKKGGAEAGVAGNAPKRLSWNTFLGTLATRLKVSPESLAKDRSLVSLLAQARLGSEVAAAEAVEAAHGGGDG